MKFNTWKARAQDKIANGGKTSEAVAFEKKLGEQIERMHATIREHVGRYLIDTERAAHNFAAFAEGFCGDIRTRLSQEGYTVRDRDSLIRDLARRSDEFFNDLVTYKVIDPHRVIEEESETPRTFIGDAVALLLPELYENVPLNREDLALLLGTEGVA